MKSLIGNKQAKVDNREPLITVSKAKEAVKEETRAYHRERHNTVRINWKTEKEVVESFQKSDGLGEYLRAKRHERNALRNGQHTLKVNAYEYALLLKTMEKMNCRSTREMLVQLCEKVK